MAGLGNNLYPPIFKKAYMPAFSKSNREGCRIYFSLSAYNSLDQFAKYPNSSGVADLVQVSIQNQNTNYSALNLNKYPSGIMDTTMYYDKDRKTEDKYYIIINTYSENQEVQTVQTEENDSQNKMERTVILPDLASGNVFNAGQFYKVQIRFTGSGVKSLPRQYEQIAPSWYNENLAYFSEWSQVVLIKGISEPKILLNDFSQNMDESFFTLQDIYVIGTVDFNLEDNQYLKKYRVRIYDSNNKLLDDSKQIFTNNYNHSNEINYKIKYNLKNDNEEQYILKIYLQTNNLYEKEESYPFKVDLVQYTTLNPAIKIEATADNKGGKIKIHTYSKEKTLHLSTNYIIRRSSSKDNFEYWEDMYTFLSPYGSMLDFTWEDITVESGVWYKYSLQQRNIQGFRSNFLETSLVMVVFDEIFLIDSQQQLKVKFDPQVNNYSHVVSESLTQTIGSKYPFIRRNGNTDYRTFTLTGTISHFMDARENKMKASQLDLYQNSLDKYREYNAAHGINDFNNSVYERDFRQKVIEFLYRNNVKLYKSTTQGNILVKLMNISFTPNNTLSRHIYSFSCTAQEIDEFNIQNCNKYGIQRTGEYTSQTSLLIKKFGQVIVPDIKKYYSTVSGISSDDAEEGKREGIYSKRNVFGTTPELHFGEKNYELIQNYILPKYKNLENDEVSIKIDYLSYLKIEFTSPPYLITQNPEGKHSLRKSQINDGKTPYFLGYVVIINGQQIIVGPEGIYQLADDSTKVTSVAFLPPPSDSTSTWRTYETAYISYEAVISEEEKALNIPKMYGNFKRIGQIFGYFNSSQSIYKKIYSRYYQSSYVKEEDTVKTAYSQEMQHIMGMRITARPSTLVFVQQDNFYQGYVINDTGLLEFYDDKTDIKGCYIIGPQLQQVFEVEEGTELKDNEFFLTDISAPTFQEIQNPKKNYVYSLSSENSLAILRSKFYKTNQVNMLGVKMNQPDEIFINDFQTATLNKKLAESQYCIFYNGSWYLFSLKKGNPNPEEKNGVNTVLGYPTEAIIDYYCQILRKRY